MEYLSAFIVLFLPGTLAGLLHSHLHRSAGRKRVLFFGVFYTLFIDWCLCLIKMIRGWGDWNAARGFSSAGSFVAYGLIALLLALVLPYAIAVWFPPVFLRLNSCLQEIWQLRKIQVKRSRNIKEEFVSATIDRSKMQQRTWWKRAFGLNASPLKMTAILCGTLIVGSGLLVAVSAIPDTRIDRNIEITSEKMIKEGKYPEYIPGSVYYKVDNWTEAAMLNMLYNGSSSQPVEGAFAQKEFWPDSGDRSGVGRLAAAVVGGNEKNGHFMLRSAYWLGCRIFVLPLLNWTDYYTIRMILLFASIVMMFSVAVFLAKRVSMQVGTAFFLSIVMTNVYISALQWCNGILCLWISAVAIFYIVKKSETEINYCYLFLLTGAATCYFDWFSIPLISFGLPLLVIMVIEAKKSTAKAFLDHFNIIFKSSVGWCLGYGAMMIGRTVISTAVEGTGSFQNFLERLFHNIMSSGNTAGQSGFGERLGTIIKGFQGIFPVLIGDERTAGIILTVGVLLTAVLAVLFRKKIPLLGPQFIISLAPVVWFAVFSGYCRVHYWIAYRVFCITAFGWILILTEVGRYLCLVRKESHLK